MKVRDLEYVEDAESPHWFGVIDDDSLNCHLYLVAGESGPSDRQYEIMYQFLEKKDELLSQARSAVLTENGNRKLDMTTFHLGAIFVHAEEEKFDLDLAGSVRAKGFFWQKEIPWNATVSTETFKMNMDSQQGSAHNSEDCVPSA